LIRAIVLQPGYVKPRKSATPSLVRPRHHEFPPSKEFLDYYVVQRNVRLDASIGPLS